MESAICRDEWSKKKRFPRDVAADTTGKRAALEALAFRAIGSLHKRRLQLGQIFLALKDTLQHGEWQPYFYGRFGKSGIPLRSAEKYMVLARRGKIVFQTILEAGLDEHALKIQELTEEAKVATAQATKSEPLYRLPLHLCKEQREMTDRLWRSPERGSAETEVVAALRPFWNKLSEIPCAQSGSETTLSTQLEGSPGSSSILLTPLTSSPTTAE